MNHFRLKYKPREKRRRIWLVLLGISSILVFCSLYFFFLKSKTTVQPEIELTFHVTEGGFKERSTLYQSLVQKNIPLRWIDLIISKLEPFIDFNKIKGGTYRFITDMEGEMVKFIYEAGPTEIYEIRKNLHGEYIVERQKVPLQIHLVKVMGEIHSSLFEGMNDVGEQDELALAFAGILAWEIDFYQDVREGDRFKVVVEKIYKGDQFIQYGTIHAVEYQKGEEIIRGIRYKDSYYDEKGISLRRAFLKAPLSFSRISSRFSRARRHPILGGTFPHFGVDYAAPIGTPVWAVADGTVLSVGWAGGFGKQVVLRHMNGYKTYYGHLSRYGLGIKKGQRVKQKQIIAYVGTTGLSTGPHLDYRLSKDGQFQNPLKKTFPPGPPIPKEEMEKFRKKKEEIVAWLMDDALQRVRLEEITGDVLEKD
jgi:murein DD-endopeptidase MepM/ murein hydrolase activator NlpD